MFSDTKKRDRSGELSAGFWVGGVRVAMVTKALYLLYFKHGASQLEKLWVGG